jgi:hypothetical protein
MIKHLFDQYWSRADAGTPRSITHAPMTRTAVSAGNLSKWQGCKELQSSTISNSMSISAVVFCTKKTVFAVGQFLASSLLEAQTQQLPLEDHG